MNGFVEEPVVDGGMLVKSHLIRSRGFDRQMMARKTSKFQRGTFCTSLDKIPMLESSIRDLLLNGKRKTVPFALLHFLSIR